MHQRGARVNKTGEGDFGFDSLLLPRLLKSPQQCYSNGTGNLGNLGRNKGIQPEGTRLVHGYHLDVFSFNHPRHFVNLVPHRCTVRVSGCKWWLT